MPSTFEGLAVVLIALLPGALVIFAFERRAGRWAIGIGERLLRFIGISALLAALQAPVSYLIWHAYLRPEALGPDEKLPLWLWPVMLAYVLVPLAIGWLLGWLFERRTWAGFLGARPPTAWDALFFGDPQGTVLIRLKSTRWIGGRYGRDSYAGGYPEPPDLYLQEEYVVDQKTEDLMLDDLSGEPLSLSRGLLVRWDEVEYLEFQED